MTERRGTDSWILQTVRISPFGEDREVIEDLSEAKRRIGELADGSGEIWQARVLSAKNPKRVICYLWGKAGEVIDLDRRKPDQSNPLEMPMPE